MDEAIKEYNVALLNLAAQMARIGAENAKAMEKLVAAFRTIDGLTTEIRERSERQELRAWVNGESISSRRPIRKLP